MTAVQNAAPAPCLFVSHGTGPFPLLDPEQESYRQLVRSHGSKIEGVKGILLFSAHWETEKPHITASADPGIYHDFEGERDVVPKEAFEFEYPAKGQAELAQRIAKRLKDLGFDPVLDYKRGLDHAVFVPMTLMRPQADIPIVQMSVLKGKDDAETTELNIRLGEAVECFRDEGYAVIGSGGSFHDFNAFFQAFFHNNPVPQSATGFETFLEQAASIPQPEERKKTLLSWRDLPDSYKAHVTNSSEHLMPFMVAAGAGGKKSGSRYDQYHYRGAPMSFFEW